MTPEQARAALLSRAALESRGFDSRRISAAVHDGTLAHVSRGWYAPGTTWQSAYPEGRHLIRVVAAFARSAARGPEPVPQRRDGGCLRAERPGVAALCSAAALHGLPFYRFEPERVHVVGATMNGWTALGEVARHRAVVADDDVVVIGGIPTTSLARTVADLARALDPIAALVAADAAFRQRVWTDATRTYDTEAAEAFRDEVLTRLPRGARGVRRARETLAFADGRADGPGESASRALLVRIGFAAPRLQVAIPGPAGSRYFVDFGIDDAHAWGEFDGQGKYRDVGLRGEGVSAEDVVLAEKMREDWIRGTTGRHLARWSFAHLTSPATLAARLAAFHVHPPTRMGVPANHLVAFESSRFVATTRR